MSRDDKVKIVVRAFTADGYSKDVLVMCSDQVRMRDMRVTDPVGSVMSGLIGHGGAIDPTKFSEMVRFEVVVTRYS